MKKIFSFWVMLATVCCLSSSAMAKATSVQEYEFDIKGIEEKKPCPSPYYFSPESRPENADCIQHSKRKECYRCFCSAKTYPYLAGDCGEFKPGGRKCTIPNGETRYETCECPEGYYSEDALTSTTPVNDKTFVYTEKTNKKGKKISCWRPKSCKNGAEINEGSLSVNKTGKTATTSNSCTVLTIASALKSDNKDNIWCATGYNCLGACGVSKGAAECAFVSTDEALKSYYTGARCEYYSRCSTVDPCTNRNNLPSGAGIKTVQTATVYDVNGNKKDECYKVSRCETTLAGDHLDSAPGLSKSGVTSGIIEVGLEQNGVDCARYSCNSSEGWEFAKSAANQSVNTSELENDSEGNKYDIAIVSTGGTFFACRRIIPEEPEPELCFIGCEVGGWYDLTNKNCKENAGTSSSIVLSKTEEDVSLAEIDKLSEKTFAGIQEMDKSNFLSQSDAEKIEPQLMARYGTNNCFIIKTGIVRIDSSGNLASVSSETEFGQYCAGGGKLGAVLDDSAPAIDCAAITDCLECMATSICHWVEDTSKEEMSEDSNQSNIQTFEKCTVGHCA